MKKIIMTALMLLVFAWQAEAIFLELVTGRVYDSYNNRGEQGIRVTVSGCGFSQSVYTDYNGYWGVYMQQCSGYTISYRGALPCFHSIPSQHVSNPLWTTPGFLSTIINAPTTPLYAIDSDGDRLCDARDNCPSKMNANGYGTCSKPLSKRSTCCFENKTCGCGGKCSKYQEDADGDGIGDACDSDACGVPLAGIIFDRDIDMSEVEGMIENTRDVLEGVIYDGDIEMLPFECPFYTEE